MSCDYGFYCFDCKSSKVPDNLSSYAIADAFKAIDKLAELYQVVSAVRHIGVLDIDVSAYWCRSDFGEFLEWIYEHHQHTLVVINEYGEELPNYGHTQQQRNPDDSTHTAH